MTLMSDIIFSREWSMPSSKTFSILPIRDLLNRYVGGVTVDPFANGSRVASVTNDIDPQYDTDHHLDAVEFLELFDDASVDCVLFDPPYSPRQLSECYRKLGRAVNMETTQSSFWTRIKREIGRIVKPSGIVVSCGWSSGGCGKKLGFKLVEILMVPHGAGHNDTIVTVERKYPDTQMNLWSESK